MTNGNRKMVKIFSLLGIPFLMLLIALSFKIYYALNTHQPVLDKNYYEKGLKYESYKKATANSKNRVLLSDLITPEDNPHNPIMKKLISGMNDVHIIYTNNSKKPVPGAKISLELSRRATVNDNIHATCNTGPSGGCTLKFNITHQGYWEGWIKATDPDGQFRLAGIFYVNP